MTDEDAIEYNKNLREYMRITDKNSKYKFLKENYEALDMAIKALELQPEWIPVSERLPESSGVYIVSRWFSDGYESRILTDACYFDGTNIWHNDIGINHSRDYLNEKIVAWMPLPEPYKEKQE